MASLLFARGLLLALTSEGSTTYTIDDPAFLALGRSAVLGVGTPVWIAVVLLGLGGLVLHHTRFGQTVFAVGGAENSALLMGLPVARAKLVVYTASGRPAGLAGVLTAAYLQSGVTVIGVGTELDAIAAVVIGGTLLTGGAGTVLGTAVGVLLRNVISNIINQVGGLDSNNQSVISGGVPAGGRGAAAGALGPWRAAAASAVAVRAAGRVPERRSRVPERRTRVPERRTRAHPGRVLRPCTRVLRLCT